MLEESSKHHWLRIAAIIIMTFIIAFLAFYCALEIMIHKMTDPMYNAKHIERIIKQQEKDFKKFEHQFSRTNPFEPKMRPMLINLVKENNEYKVIVDLEPLDNDENLVKVSINNEELTVSGELEKKVKGSEKIISFNQTYYLDEKLDETKMTKEKNGNKYIITIPFKE